MSKLIFLKPMQFEVSVVKAGKPSYAWRQGWLAQNEKGNDVYPPCYWEEALDYTLKCNPGALVKQGDHTTTKEKKDA